MVAAAFLGSSFATVFSLGLSTYLAGCFSLALSFVAAGFFFFLSSSSDDEDDEEEEPEDEDESFHLGWGFFDSDGFDDVLGSFFLPSSFSFTSLFLTSFVLSTFFFSSSLGLSSFFLGSSFAFGFSFYGASFEGFLPVLASFFF